MAVDDSPVLDVTSVDVWHKWLADNFNTSTGAWLKLAKKASGLPTVAHDEILDLALCYGWIDAIRKGYDDQYFLQKFTPRRPKGTWSKRNVDSIARLTRAGRMQPSGIAEVERAQADGRWDAAYDSQANMTIPDDFLAAVQKNPQAYATYKTLNRTNLFAIMFRLQTAKKPETRQRRFDKILDMLERGEKFY